MKTDKISTPICDFLRDYAGSGMSRFHMPGHKGQSPFQESISYAMDITEVSGADALYLPEGIIRESERNAAVSFGTESTFYSVEGSSQCIKAMLALVTKFHHNSPSRPVILAARNVHAAFVSAAALLDLDVVWMYPETSDYSLCCCPVTPGQVQKALAQMAQKPAAVYLTSPDYLGNMQDIAGIAKAAHEAGVPLLVDNAHGAYLHFLNPPVHPMDLGADMCCDSAHKTLPALTGCAYLHISRSAPKAWAEYARQALLLFGSTSPSYLLLQSLDALNSVLAGWKEPLAQSVEQISSLKSSLRGAGWVLAEDQFHLPKEPLKITICTSACHLTGMELASRLRSLGIECEYADPDFLVLMCSPSNTEADYQKLSAAMDQITQTCFSGAFCSENPNPGLTCPRPEQAISIRDAAFLPSRTVSAKDSVGCICTQTLLSCPPAVPVVICGERIPKESVLIFRHYGIQEIRVADYSATITTPS